MLAIYKEPRKRQDPIDYPDGPEGREVLNLDTVAGRREYRRRMLEMWERQLGKCPSCGLFITEGVRTFDHEAGRLIRDDRIWIDDQPQNACLHYHCNQAKGSKRYRWIGNKYRPVTELEEVA